MDIFNLKNLNKKFDVIECMGLIHLLTDPIEGIKNLLDVLEPHGFLKLGLFSDISKKYMNITKNLTKEKKLSNSIEDVRNFRKEIIEKKNDLIKDTNFYSYSHLMGLLFIDHKHYFSLKKIKEMIKELNLEFIGFNFSNLSTQKAYSKFFPNDKQNVSLDNWCEFERDHPHSFLNMYQFWVRKK
jgi:SAM-dependent methyltransferase